MDSDDDVPDTRIFVSGLPVKYTSAQLGAHFAGRYQITDAVVLPGRQIGFVGFRNYTLAKNSIKYFDKTYIRMSKISVSFAKPVELTGDSHGRSAPANKRDTSGTAQSGPSGAVDREPLSSNGSSGPVQRDTFTPYKPVTQMQNRKRKIGDEDATNVIDAPRPAEHTYSGRNGKEEKREGKQGKRATSLGDTPVLGDKTPVTKEDNIIQITSKERKERKKKDAKGEKVVASEAKEQNTAENHATASNEEREARKKRKADKRSKPTDGSNSLGDGSRGREDPHTDITLSPEVKSKKRKEAKHEREGAVHPSDDEMTSTRANEGTDTSQQPQPTSDMDWLRTRTTRTLDILDEPSENHATTQSDVTDLPTLDNPINADTSDVNHIEANVSNAPQIPNGRLFVRNLPYDVTEDSLTNVFQKYGKLEEVRDFLLFRLSIYDEYPDRDILCFASDVLSQRIF